MNPLVTTTLVRAHGPTQQPGEQHVALRWWRDAVTGDYQVWTGQGLPAELAGADNTLPGAVRALAPLLAEHGWVLVVAGIHPGAICDDETGDTQVRLPAGAVCHALDPLTPTA